MDYEHIVKQIEETSHQAVEYLSNRSNLEKIGKITAISVATYVVADVKRQKKFWLHKCSDFLLDRNYTMLSLDPWAVSLAHSGADSLNFPNFTTTDLAEQGKLHRTLLTRIESHALYLATRPS